MTSTPADVGGRYSALTAFGLLPAALAGIDVARIAKRFGGGGHSRAAGSRASGDLDAFKKRLIDACAEALAQA